MKLLSASILAATLLAGCGGMSTAMAPDTPTKTADGVLVGPDGKSLYTFTRDTANSGKSVCNAACAKLWPALPVAASAKPMGGYTVIMRDDGTKQWAYNGWPLYYYANDAKAGDRTGDNFNNAWKLARP
ncbi:MAG: ATP-binding protein [Variovorax sp.]|jgi:predicted lipoprotein with Yx(FWY)xxD motif|nr:ATP-binding protein [Variovorax sp.]